MATFNIYDPRDLYAVMYDKRLEAPSNYWLSLLFPNNYQSMSEDIVFEKITGRRRIAPFVLPTVQGKPVFTPQGSDVRIFRPAYIKPKDAVRPTDMLKRQPGDLFTAVPRTPQQNFDMRVADIMQFHRSSINRRWEWLAARAAIDGQVVIASDDYPSVTVDFRRDAGQTIVLGAGSRWGDDGVSILDTIQSWMDMMSDAKFGGIPTRLTVAPDVWAVMRKDPELLEEMDLFRRGNTELDVSTGLTGPAQAAESFARRMGSLGAGLDLWVYRDFYEDSAGAHVPYLDSGTVVMTSPGVEGVKAFGAILDTRSGIVPLDIFPKMWDQDDPSARFIMSQSAPLMIPVNPNCTLKAKVLA